MIGLAKPVSRGAKAVVTGAGSGIGQSFAVELAKRGSEVVCADIDLTGAAETVARIEAAGGRALAVESDVSREDAVASLLETSTSWLGRAPSLLVNNAGIGAGGHSVGATSLDDWERTLGINLWGVIYGCHFFIPAMKAAGRGG